MLIPPKYFLTSTITRLLQTIEANRQLIDAFPLPIEIETNIRRQSILKSSLFSARIEGNPLTLEQLQKVPSKDQKKQEVENILHGFSFLQTRGATRDITLKTLLKLHAIVMIGLIEKENLGTLRHEVSAIFNTAGIAIYLPPPPRQISAMLTKLLRFANSDKEEFVPLRAMLSHYTFEKIHPFLDGNGRVGRLLLHAILEKGGYGMKGLVSIEEYLDKHRNMYYATLETTEKDVTEYLEFMLQALADTSEKTKELIRAKQQIKPQDYLLPRRAEILNIITDHRIINFDQIRRRFLSVNERTLRYDLKKLVDGGLIKKLGTTNGVYYEVND